MPIAFTCLNLQAALYPNNFSGNTVQFVNWSCLYPVKTLVKSQVHNFLLTGDSQTGDTVVKEKQMLYHYRRPHLFLTVV